MKISKRWVIESGEGHWDIYINGVLETSCDDGELTEVINELREDMGK